MSASAKTSSKLILAAVVITLGCLTVWGAITLRDMLQKQSVLVGCHSDKLLNLCTKFQIYAEAHGGHFPDPSHVADVLGDTGNTNLLYCVRTHQQFVWSSQLADIPLDSPHRHLLASCLTGSHGRYVGVLAVYQRKVEAEIITVDELQRLRDSASQ